MEIYVWTMERSKSHLLKEDIARYGGVMRNKSLKYTSEKSLEDLKKIQIYETFY